MSVTFVTPYLVKGRIEIPVEKYLPAYKENLKKLRQTVHLAGFRPGHVPIEYIRGRYGKETLEKLLSREFFAQLESLLGEDRLMGVPLYAHEPEEIVTTPPYVDYVYEFEALVRPTEPLTIQGPLPPLYKYEAASEDSELFRRYTRMLLGQKENIEHLPPEIPADREVYVRFQGTLPSGKSFVIRWASFLEPFPYSYLAGRKVGEELDMPPSHLVPYTEIIRAVLPDFSPLTTEKVTLRIHSALLITPASDEALDKAFDAPEKAEKAQTELFERTLQNLLDELNLRTYQNGVLHAAGIEIPARLIDLNYLFYVELQEQSGQRPLLSYEKYARTLGWRIFMESHIGHIPDLEVSDEAVETDIWNKVKANMEATEKGREILAQFADNEDLKRTYMQILSEKDIENIRSSIQYERFDNWLAATYGPRPEKMLPLRTILLAGL